MELRLETSDLLALAGVPDADVDAYHFDAPPLPDLVRAVTRLTDRPFSERIQANQRAVRYIAENTSLFPVGMLIGPFSLMTKLVADPIIPVATAGSGVTAGEDTGVLMIERCLEMARATVERSAIAQIQAGAKAIIVCEPAANKVYISPRQLRGGSTVFERYVLEPNRSLRNLMAARGADLIFHNCGELLDEMVRQFAVDLHPVVLSLGSSRKLWEDAALVPDDVVLFGNLPTKTFYSDAVMPVQEVIRRTEELRVKMRDCGHAHILGSECDVLHVPESAETIRRKVDAMLTCPTVAAH
jgi:uroporphyrinogen-III decarboxylase